MPAVSSMFTNLSSGFSSSLVACRRRSQGKTRCALDRFLALFARKIPQLLLVVLASINVPLAVMAEESEQRPAVKSPLATKVLLTDSVKLSSGRYVAVGLYGIIIYSDDQGETWQQAKSPTQVLLTNVFFLNDKLGWVGAHDTVILHTKDGGETWEIQHEDPIPGGDIPKPVLDIHFTSASNGFAIGAYGLMLKTTDGGANWESVDTLALYDRLEALEMEPEPNFNYMIPFGDSILIAGELGTILVFDPDAVDEEQRWQIIESPYEGTFFGVTQLGSGDIYLYGLRGNIYRSRDQGRNWEKIETDVIANIYGCTQLANGKIVFLGSSGTILTMEANDSQTKKHPYPGFDTKITAELVDGSDVLMFGSNGVQLFTIN